MKTTFGELKRMQMFQFPGRRTIWTKIGPWDRGAAWGGTMNAECFNDKNQLCTRWVTASTEVETDGDIRDRRQQQ